MSSFAKTGNVLCIVLAWLLSIVLVIMLMLAPMALSALSLLNPGTITQVVIDTLAQSLTPEEKEDTAGDYALTKLSNVSNVAEKSDTNPAEDLLKGVLGDQASPELVEKILASKAAKELIKAYTGDLTDVIVGNSNKAPQMNAEKIKAIVNDNMDEIVEIARQIKPDMTEEDVAKLKSTITQTVEENAEEIIQALPKPEEIKEQLIEDSPELETALEILAKKNAIKWAAVGIITFVCALIFVCRLWGFRGFRWLAVDLFVGGGINALISIGLLAGTSVLMDAITEPAAATIVQGFWSAFTTGMLVRTAVILLAGGLSLTAYILIKKLRAKKTAANVEE